jgi:hypothetical protein
MSLTERLWMDSNNFWQSTNENTVTSTKAMLNQCVSSWSEKLLKIKENNILLIHSGLGDKEKIFMTSWVSLNARVLCWYFPLHSVQIVNANPNSQGML